MIIPNRHNLLLLYPLSKIESTSNRSVTFYSWYYLSFAIQSANLLIEHLSKDLAEESSKMFVPLLYQLMLSMATDIPKPLSQITLAEIFNFMQSEKSA